MKQVNILPHEIAGGKQLNMVSYVNINDNMASADGCNEIENLPGKRGEAKKKGCKNLVKYLLHVKGNLIQHIMIFRLLSF